MIRKYIEKTNRFNISSWTVRELKDFLTSDSEDISFSEYAESYIRQMRNDGRKKPADNYSVALRSLEKHHGRPLNFTDVTSKSLREWIATLSGTKRAKQLYPVIIKKLFNEGCLEYNDYERDIIRISGQPFRTVKIPESEVPEKRSIEIESLRKILGEKPLLSREELAHDVSMLVLCLAGINTVDLYNMETHSFAGGKIRYNRTKTKKKRRDKAYMEITVRDEILPLFEKHKGKRALFGFSERYSTSDDFCKAVNTGLKNLCDRAGQDGITVYSLRHTWATVAQNDCGASTELVAFALNHQSAHKVTEGYIKKDYSPVDRLNECVIKKIFGQ
jgi:integrase